MTETPKFAIQIENDLWKSQNAEMTLILLNLLMLFSILSVSPDQSEKILPMKINIRKRRDQTDDTLLQLMTLVQMTCLNVNMKAENLADFNVDAKFAARVKSIFEKINN